MLCIKGVPKLHKIQFKNILAMDKKTKIALAIQLTMKLLTKQTEKNAAKKTLPMTKYYLVLIIIVNFFLCYVCVMLLYGLL